MSLTGAAFVLVYLAGLGLSFTRSPLFGLYTYIAVFYLHPPSRWWGETLPDMRWALLAALVTIISAARVPDPPGRPTWIQTTPAKLLVWFTVWFWIQTLWALQPEKHIEAASLFTKYVLLFYLIYKLVTNVEQIKEFLVVHLLGCGYLGWLAFNTTARTGSRLEGVGGPGIDEANAFAMQMGTGLVVAAVFVLAISGWRRWVALAVAPFILNGIILSGSRGGFLALICGGAVIWYLKPKLYRFRFYALAALGVVLLGALAHDVFWERLGTMKAAVAVEEEEMDNSALSRFALVEAQSKMAARYPHGTGHRGTETLSLEYLEARFLTTRPDGTPGPRSSHNTFMSALVEQGVFGAIFYIWIWWWSARTVLQLGRETATEDRVNHRLLVAAVGAALVVVLVAGIFVDYLKAEAQIWFWALLASLAAMKGSDVAHTQSGPALRRQRATIKTIGARPS